jgi:hypothetical protein
MLSMDQGASSMTRAVLMALSYPVAVADTTGKIFLSNHQWQEVLFNQLLCDFIEEGRLLSLWDNKTAQHFHQSLEAVVTRRISRFVSQVMIRKEELDRWYQISLDPLDPNLFDGVVVSFVDVTQQKRLLDQVSHLLAVSSQQNQLLRDNKEALLKNQVETKSTLARQ